MQRENYFNDRMNDENALENNGSLVNWHSFKFTQQVGQKQLESL